MKSLSAPHSPSAGTGPEVSVWPEASFSVRQKEIYV